MSIIVAGINNRKAVPIILDRFDLQGTSTEATEQREG